MFPLMVQAASNFLLVWTGSIPRNEAAPKICSESSVFADRSAQQGITRLKLVVKPSPGLGQAPILKRIFGDTKIFGFLAFCSFTNTVYSHRRCSRQNAFSPFSHDNRQACPWGNPFPPTVSCLSSTTICVKQSRTPDRSITALFLVVQRKSECCYRGNVKETWPS